MTDGWVGVGLPGVEGTSLQGTVCAVIRAVQATLVDDLDGEATLGTMLRSEDYAPALSLSLSLLLLPPPPLRCDTPICALPFRNIL